MATAAAAAQDSNKCGQVRVFQVGGRPPRAERKHFIRERGNIEACALSQRRRCIQFASADDGADGRLEMSVSTLATIKLRVFKLYSVEC